MTKSKKSVIKKSYKSKTKNAIAKKRENIKFVIKMAALAAASGISVYALTKLYKYKELVKEIVRNPAAAAIALYM